MALVLEYLQREGDVVSALPSWNVMPGRIKNR
jgi:hypothetical protein